MKRLLFYSEAWGRGGIETFIKNVFPDLISHGFTVEIMTTWSWSGIDEPVVDCSGLRRTCVFRGYRPNQLKRLLCGLRVWRSMIKTGSYDAVWINTMNGTGFLYSAIAHHYGVSARVVHSHNSDVGDGMKRLKRAAGKFCSFIFGWSSTLNVACSAEAGNYLFGSRPYQVIPNGIDIERFQFSSICRNEIRRQLNVQEHEQLIGNIGRICQQKNPLFQVEVFAEYKRLNPKAKYLMLGRGDMKEEVIALASKLGVAEDLMIRDSVDDPAPYYSALDALLMPSLYEGFGFVKIEAQCASLPILCTEGLPEESDITDLVKTCTLSAAPRVWARHLYDLVVRTNGERSADYASEVGRAGYSLQACSDAVLSCLGGEEQ